MLIKHLTSVSLLDAQDILSIFERADYFSKLSKTTSENILQGNIVANLFFENSTRTKFSFEIAAKKLGAHVINFNSESSSISKGESLTDTLKTFEALGVDTAIIRHSDDAFIESIKKDFRFNIVNAGAGKKEHPSQSLLDLFTMQQEFGKLKGLTVLICGDISSSRVAKSNIEALSKFGVRILLSGPEDLMPSQDELHPSCEILEIDEAIAECDVAMFLRIQHERHHLVEIDLKNYNRDFGLNQTRANKLKKNAIIMHPGPFNRDIEISSELIESPKSRIFKQMENGVYTRMAILEWVNS